MNYPTVSSFLFGVLYHFTVLCRHPVATCPKCNRCGQKKGWRQAKKNRRKGNSNALPGNSRQPATTSPHDISERKMRQSLLQHRRVAFHFNVALSPISPNWLNNNPIRASYIPPTDTIHRVFPPVRLRNVSEVNARRLRHHQLRTLRFP